MYSLLALKRKYKKRAKAVFMGRNRIVYDMGKYVVKIPLNEDGIADNDWEGSTVWEDSPDHITARTRAAWVDCKCHGVIPILFAERVNFEALAGVGYEALPEWAGSIDCGQVGYTKKGKLVAYDFGIR